MWQDVAGELAEPQRWGSFGVGSAMRSRYRVAVPIILGPGIGATALSALSHDRGRDGHHRFGAFCCLEDDSSALHRRTICSPLSVHDQDVRLIRAHMAVVFGLLAMQLLSSVYGVWRIWRSRQIEGSVGFGHTTPFAAALNGSSVRVRPATKCGACSTPTRRLVQMRS